MSLQNNECRLARNHALIIWKVGTKILIDHIRERSERFLEMESGLVH